MKTRFNQLISFVPLISNKVKLTISSLLLLFALAICLINDFSIDACVILLAMFFSFLGDFALNCVPLEKRPHWQLYLGAFFFMIAHLTYATAYYWLISVNEELFFNLGAIIACIFMVLLFATSVTITILSKHKPNPMTIIVFCIYTWIIGINFVTIYSYSWSFGSISFIGALSFLLSDFIIGIETVFKVKSVTLRKLVWIFYPIGQVLIIACH